MTLRGPKGLSGSGDVWRETVFVVVVVVVVVAKGSVSTTFLRAMIVRRQV